MRGLTKVFKDFWGRPKARAVDNVDFEVRRGEVFGLLGPNGSGKSTTVKLLLGLLLPDQGAHRGLRSFAAARGDQVAHRLPAGGILSLPLPRIRARRWISSATCSSLPKGERDNRAEQLLEMVGLSQTRTRAVGEFSKGMQRRIGLAQALINDPDLVILDEPTSGLDPIGCREVKDLILALARRGKTVILSSHLLADVEDVCDRVVIYYGGKVQAMGTLEGAAGHARRRPHHHAGAVRARRWSGCWNSSARTWRRTRCAWTPRRRTWRATSSKWSRSAQRAAAKPPAPCPARAVAAYLRGEAEPSPRRDKILERLTAPQAAAPAATPAPVADGSGGRAEAGER